MSRTARSFAFVVIMMLIWGNLQQIGTTPPGSTELVIDATWRVWWTWPYWAEDASGARVVWTGVLIGVASSLLAGWLLLRESKPLAEAA